MQIIEAKKLLDIPQLWALLRLPGKPRKSCHCPWRRDAHASFSVFADGSRWKDHATGEAGDVVDFYQMATGLSQSNACREFLRIASGGKMVVACPPPLPPRIAFAPPTLSSGTASHWDVLATTRCLPAAAVGLAVERGLVQFGVHRSRSAWFVTDSSRHVIQARRLDGARWWPLGPKAMNLLGGTASWPVGAADMGSFPRIILVEGGPDLLAAFHFLLLAGAIEGTTVVAILGAANGIHPDALGLFAGKRVRIVPHRDQPDKKGRRAGIDAARKWQKQLQGTVTAIDVVPIDALVSERETVKDLNDLCRLQVDCQATVGRRLFMGSNKYSSLALLP